MLLRWNRGTHTRLVPANLYLPRDPRQTKRNNTPHQFPTIHRSLYTHRNSSYPPPRPLKRSTPCNRYRRDSTVTNPTQEPSAHLPYTAPIFTEPVA